MRLVIFLINLVHSPIHLIDQNVELIKEYSLLTKIADIDQNYEQVFDFIPKTEASMYHSCSPDQYCEPGKGFLIGIPSELLVFTDSVLTRVDCSQKS